MMITQVRADVPMLSLQVENSHRLSVFSSQRGSHPVAAIQLAGTPGLASSSLPGLGHVMSAGCEQNVCNDSSSPTDSGISVDAVSSVGSARATAAVETAVNHRALTHALSLPAGTPGTLFTHILLTAF